MNVVRLVSVVRNRLKLTQKQFAQRLGTTETTVWRWEQGKCAPMPFFRRRIEEMAKALQVVAK